MSKMSINDAAEYFGVSKEAIHNRIRRGSLEVVIEDDVKMVVVNGSPVTPKTKSSQKTTAPDDRYYKLLEEQNTKLQAKVEFLEGETRTLRDQKEQMLIAERIKIEQIYKDKDEQLKNILNTLASQFQLAPSLSEKEDDALEAEIESFDDSEPISLKKYLKTTEFSDKEKKKIKERFQKHASSDERIILIGNKCYIDTTKYEYKDLIR